MNSAVREWIAAARRIAVLTGAGVSAESGVPTFRDAQTGLWSKFRPEDLATEEAFRSNPARVWDWYAMRRAMIAKVEPNAAHRAIAAFQERHPGRLTLITQNVDGLHQRAGNERRAEPLQASSRPPWGAVQSPWRQTGGPTSGVLALHGNIFEDKWLDTPRDCCHPDMVETGSPPACPRCGNMLRPSVVWFGEVLPWQALEAAQRAARECDLMLVVGTSGVVYPAAGLARSVPAHAKVVIVNPEPTELDDAGHAVLRGKAAELLPDLLKD